MPTSLSIFVFTVLLTLSHSKVQYTISNLNVNFPQSINNYVPNCVSVDLEFFVQIATSNYTSQSIYYVNQYPAGDSSLQITNNTIFTIPYTTNFYSITALLSMKCSANPIPVVDSFVVANQYIAQPDRNGITDGITFTSLQYGWTLGGSKIRICDTTGQYGFNCNENCDATNDDYYCYTCGSNGQKICCTGVNSDDCSQYSPPPSTTYSPNCLSNAETTYMWLMISFAIVILILLIVIIIFILETCCGVFGFTARKRKEEDEEWVVEDERRSPRATRDLYDGDVNMTRKREARNYENPERNHRMPYVIHKEGLPNRVYEEESIGSDWSDQPQPRREARV